MTLPAHGTPPMYCEWKEELLFNIISLLGKAVRITVLAESPIKLWSWPIGSATVSLAGVGEADVCSTLDIVNSEDVVAGQVDVTMSGCTSKTV
jgi:hypothetical protein